MMENASKQYSKSYDHYASVYTQFMQFEDVAVDYFSDTVGAGGKRVLTSDEVGDMREKIANTTKDYKSPFLEASLWIKGEMLDIAGMLNAMKGREAVMKRQLATESKKRDDNSELEKLSLGKTTMRSFFKSKEGKEKDILKYQASIEQCNQDIEEYRKLLNFITVYQGHYAIEKFKKDNKGSKEAIVASQTRASRAARWARRSPQRSSASPLTTWRRTRSSRAS